MRNLLKIFLTILNLLLYIKILIMVITCTANHYSINIESILRSWTTNLLIPPTYAELMVGHRHTMDGDNPLCLRALPK